jgi:hypothetical protein
MISTAFLFASSAAGLMAQTELASNTMPHETLPLISAPSQTDKTGASLFNVAPDTYFGVPKPESFRQSSVAPGTIAKSSAAPLKPSHTSGFRVEPDYLPSWVTNEPLSYLRYGAAPAVVTLHFGRK